MCAETLQAQPCLGKASVRVAFEGIIGRRTEAFPTLEKGDVSPEKSGYIVKDARSMAQHTGDRRVHAAWHGTQATGNYGPNFSEVLHWVWEGISAVIQYSRVAIQCCAIRKQWFLVEFKIA